tara:strand:- start:8787 stop:8960 length:174 start_codon:yes stop_codon:yes gene_type:complete
MSDNNSKKPMALLLMVVVAVLVVIMINNPEKEAEVSPVEPVIESATNDEDSNNEENK